MSDGILLTGRMKHGLGWISSREPIGAFDVSGPTLRTVRRLEQAGLIERVGKEPGLFGFIKYRLTQEGRNAIGVSPTKNEGET